MSSLKDIFSIFVLRSKYTMTKVRTKAIFKTYNQQQSLLLPPTLDELISTTHLVRVVNQVVEEMDITPLIEQYQGGGTSSYHPRMLLKVLLYGYSVKIYTGRKIAKALIQDINFMWLSGMSHPDFRTINGFRSSRAKEVIEELFKELLWFLMDQKYIRMENYFCDGSTFIADGNKHKMVWKKNAQRYKEVAEKNCQQLFRDIDKLNQQEDKQYGDQDLEEKGEQSIDKQAGKSPQPNNRHSSKKAAKAQSRKPEEETARRINKDKEVPKAD